MWNQKCLKCAQSSTKDLSWFIFQKRERAKRCITWLTLLMEEETQIWYKNQLESWWLTKILKLSWWITINQAGHNGITHLSKRLCRNMTWSQGINDRFQWLKRKETVDLREFQVILRKCKTINQTTQNHTENL